MEGLVTVAVSNKCCPRQLDPTRSSTETMCYALWKDFLSGWTEGGSWLFEDAAQAYTTSAESATSDRHSKCKALPEAQAQVIFGKAPGSKGCPPFVNRA
eukprot:s687_g16.t1